MTQARRVVDASLLELLYALKVVDVAAKLERRRIIEMMTLEVTVNLLGQDGLGHLRAAIKTAQRLDVEHNV